MAEKRKNARSGNTYTSIHSRAQSSWLIPANSLPLHSETQSEPFVPVCSANGLNEGHNVTYVCVCVCGGGKIAQKRLNLCGINSAGLELRATREQAKEKLSKTKKEIEK